MCTTVSNLKNMKLKILVFRYAYNIGILELLELVEDVNHKFLKEKSAEAELDEWTEEECTQVTELLNRIYNYRR